MKTLLIHYNDDGDTRDIPLGMAYICSYLRKQGKDVKLIDANALHMTLEEVGKEICKIKPDMLGTTILTYSVLKSFSLFEMAKKIDNSIITIAGGPHPTALPKDTLRNEYIDFVIRGEGEIIMNDLIDCLEKGKDYKKLDGIAFKENDKNIINKRGNHIENLDDLPFPAWKDLPIKRYQHFKLQRQNFVTMITARGCPYQCIFCAQSNIFGRKSRRRSPKNVVEEMKFLNKNYGVKAVSFNDSTFTLNKQWVMEFCRLLLEKDLDIIWCANVRADTIDEEMLSMMKQAKCKWVAMGVESGNDEMLKKMKKGESLENIRQAVKCTKKVGLKLETYFMAGLPGETKQSMKDTINFALEINPDNLGMGYSFATPYPGTEFYDIARKEGKLDGLKWDKFYHTSDITYVPNGLTKQDLFDARTHFRKLNMNKKD